MNKYFKGSVLYFNTLHWWIIFCLYGLLCQINSFVKFHSCIFNPVLPGKQTILKPTWTWNSRRQESPIRKNGRRWLSCVAVVDLEEWLRIGKDMNSQHVDISLTNQNLSVFGGKAMSSPKVSPITFTLEIQP